MLPGAGKQWVRWDNMRFTILPSAAKHGTTMDNRGFTMVHFSFKIEDFITFNSILGFIVVDFTFKMIPYVTWRRVTMGNMGPLEVHYFTQRRVTWGQQGVHNGPFQLQNLAFESIFSFKVVDFSLKCYPAPGNNG